MKQCKICRQIKPLQDFHKDRKLSDGRFNECKVCNNNRRIRYKTIEFTNIEWRERRIQYHYDRQHLYTPNVSIEKRNEYAKKQRLKRKKENHARYLANKEYPHNQPCEVCGSILTERHHDDYSKPLEIRWLCKIHHEDHHKEQNKIKRYEQYRQRKNHRIR